MGNNKRGMVDLNTSQMAVVRGFIAPVWGGNNKNNIDTGRPIKIIITLDFKYISDVHKLPTKDSILTLPHEPTYQLQ